MDPSTGLVALDATSQELIRAAATWPLPPDAVGPLACAIALLFLVAAGDLVDLLSGSGR